MNKPFVVDREDLSKNSRSRRRYLYGYDDEEMYIDEGRGPVRVGVVYPEHPRYVIRHRSSGGNLLAGIAVFMTSFTMVIVVGVGLLVKMEFDRLRGDVSSLSSKVEKLESSLRENVSFTVPGRRDVMSAPGGVPAPGSLLALSPRFRQVMLNED